AVALASFAVLYSVLPRVSLITWHEVAGRIWRPLVAGLLMVFAVQYVDVITPANHVTALLLEIPLGATVYSGALLLLWHISGRAVGAESFLLEMASTKLNWTRRT